MPALLVCPNCGSSKIGKEPGEPEYYCDACTSFFDDYEIKEMSIVKRNK
jgi:transcription initiation factor TFIIIB Brf1 subunit/transcription initiation factor TFIIB